MIMHRAIRDNARCRDRYGKAWEEYTKRVPYIFIPVGHYLGYNSYYIALMIHRALSKLVALGYLIRRLVLYRNMSVSIFF